MAEKCSRCGFEIRRRTRENHLMLLGKMLCRMCVLDKLRDRVHTLAHRLLPDMQVTGGRGPDRAFHMPARDLFHALNDAKVNLPLKDQVEYVDRLPYLAPEPSNDAFGYIETYRASAQELVQELKNGEKP